MYFFITFFSLFFCFINGGQEVIFQLSNGELKITPQDCFYQSYPCQALINFAKSMGNNVEIIDCKDKNNFDFERVYELLNKPETEIEDKNIIFLINENEKCPSVGKDLDDLRNSENLFYASMLAKRWHQELKNNSVIDQFELQNYYDQIEKILNPDVQEYLKSYLFVHCKPKLINKIFSNYVKEHATLPIKKYKQSATKRYAWDADENSEHSNSWDKAIYDLENGVEKKLSDFFQLNGAITNQYQAEQFFDVYDDHLFVFLRGANELDFVFYNKDDDTILHTESFNWFRGQIQNHQHELNHRICVTGDSYNHIYLLNQNNQYYFLLYDNEKRKLIKIEIPQPLTGRPPLGFIYHGLIDHLMDQLRIAHIDWEKGVFLLNLFQGREDRYSSYFSEQSNHNDVITIIPGDPLAQHGNLVNHPTTDHFGHINRSFCYKLNDFMNISYLYNHQPKRTELEIEKTTKQIKFTLTYDWLAKDLIVDNSEIQLNSWLLKPDEYLFKFSKKNKNNYILLYEESDKIVRLVSHINIGQMFDEYVKKKNKKLEQKQEKWQKNWQKFSKKISYTMLICCILFVAQENVKKIFYKGNQ